MSWDSAPIIRASEGGFWVSVVTFAEAFSRIAVAMLCAKRCTKTNSLPSSAVRIRSSVDVKVISIKAKSDPNSG
ncbi:unnamed protein product [Rodentolepis nana]|uniref:Secreted protein n=1 Tax=Rodentolepis nana TaxID=102285 RepID=A0A0R3TCJ8_RODNA|nr:unnamed protein product [Rodentolepis nana]